MEDESWGQLSKEQFESFLAQFTKQFGNPRKSRRIAISFWDHNRSEIDTRIKITDGKAEIMQKKGSWEKTKMWSRSEQRVHLPNDKEEIFNAYQILRVLIPGPNDCYISQYENYLFDTENFEIKLTHQTGKSDKYNFEVEATSKSAKAAEFLKQIGLAEFVIETDEEFWRKWNNELNLNDKGLSEEQIRELIESYLEK